MNIKEKAKEVNKQLLMRVGIPEEIIAEALTQAKEEGAREAESLVVGWREYDWPEGFDRYTAQLIADHLEKRLSTLSSEKV